jgi:dynein light intermediate chain 1
VVSFDDESKHAMEDNVNHWRGHKRSNTVESTSSDDAALPLGPGEWDEPLGVPLCVVCQNTDKMQNLERESGWKDEQFDFIGQYVRTILLKHGGSLIYTMPSAPGSLQPLIHTSLGIQSMLQKKELNYEVSNRDKTLVPANWDSWAKIRMMADNFDPEAVSKTWSIDIQNTQDSTEDESEDNAVQLYESDITNPKSTTVTQVGTASKSTTDGGIEISSKDVQTFLSEQSKILEEYKVSDRKDRMAQESKKESSRQPLLDDGRHVEEHIGPVQFNMGGIQVDAEEMVRKIKVCFRTLPLPSLASCRV